MKLKYTNHSPDTLSYIWFHVWPNAYRNDRTPYSEQQLENGDTRFYFSSKEQKGYLNRLDFRVNGVLASMQDHPEFIDVVKLILPRPLLPGDSISISSSFHLRLPFNFNGNGYNAHHVELRNWYPEPAVYDRHGWHPMPFLVQGGAFHEAADYTVEIESPSGILYSSRSCCRYPGSYINIRALPLSLKKCKFLCLDCGYPLPFEIRQPGNCIRTTSQDTIILYIRPFQRLQQTACSSQK